MAAESLGEKLKVFISYSRQDMAFVDRLQTALAERGIEAFVDRDHIEKSEDWWARLTQLITDADTIIFVLSPDSVNSKVCADEVAFGERLNKRFVPIVARNIPGQKVPLALSRLDYVWFIANPLAQATGDFDKALADLVRALETDIPWIRDHTRLGAVAERWEARKRPADLLLRGAERASAETWLMTRPEKAPDPTDAHRALVTLSRQASTRTQRMFLGISLIAAAVALLLAGGAFWQRQVAVFEADRAIKSENNAKATTREAQITQSGLLANAVEEVLKLPGDSGAPLALLLALEGMPDAASDDSRQASRPRVSEAQVQLDRANPVFRERIVVPHDDKVSTVAWSPDGLLLATGSDDKTARIVEAATGREIARVAHDEPVTAVAWSPDGTWLATGSGRDTKGEARIIEAATGREIIRVVHDGAVRTVASSPDGTRVATGSMDKTARIVEATTGREIARVAHDGWVNALAWSPDGTWLATGSGDLLSTKHEARVVEAATGREIARIAHEDEIRSVAWSPDGTRVATGSSDKTASIVDPGSVSGAGLATRREIARVPHKGIVWAVSWSPDGTRLATGSGDLTSNQHEARIVEAATGREIARIAHEGIVRAVAWSPDGSRLLTGSDDKSARIVEAATGREIGRVAHDSSVRAVAWSPVGTRLATGSADKTARIVEEAVGREIARVPHERGVNTVAWSLDGTRLATGSSDKSVRIVEAAMGREIARAPHKGIVWAVSWSPDGTRLATGSGDLTSNQHEARIVEAATGREIARIAHEGIVFSVAWNPDGTIIATGSNDKIARIVEAATGREIARVPHERGVNTVAWSLDGTRLATGSSDKSARIVEAATGKQIARMAHDGDVNAVAWRPLPPAPDGSTLIATGSTDNSARIWHVFMTPQALVDAAKARAARCLTQKQRSQYFLPAAPPTWCVARRLWPYHSDEWQDWLPKQKVYLASGRQGEAPVLPRAE